MDLKIGDILVNKSGKKRKEVLSIKIKAPKILRNHNQISWSYLVVDPDAHYLKYCPKWVDRISTSYWKLSKA